MPALPRNRFRPSDVPVQDPSYKQRHWSVSVRHIPITRCLMTDWCHLNQAVLSPSSRARALTGKGH
jgi:hypothetical protein